jgi:transposase
LVRGLMTEDEWVFFEPFLTGRSEQGGRPARNHRPVLDGIFWIARTGAPWRDLPEELGNWNSVWRQFRRWSASGPWGGLLQALADTGGDAETLQMIDSTIIRAHQMRPLRGTVRRSPVADRSGDRVEERRHRQWEHGPNQRSGKGQEWKGVEIQGNTSRASSRYAL